MHRTALTAPPPPQSRSALTGSESFLTGFDSAAGAVGALLVAEGPAMATVSTADAEAHTHAPAIDAVAAVASCVAATADDADADAIAAGWLSAMTAAPAASGAVQALPCAVRPRFAIPPQPQPPTEEATAVTMLKALVAAAARVPTSATTLRLVCEAHRAAHIAGGRGLGPLRLGANRSRALLANDSGQVELGPGRAGRQI